MSRVIVCCARTDGESVDGDKDGATHDHGAGDELRGYRRARIRQYGRDQIEKLRRKKDIFTYRAMLSVRSDLSGSIKSILD